MPGIPNQMPPLRKLERTQAILPVNIPPIASGLPIYTRPPSPTGVDGAPAPNALFGAALGARSAMPTEAATQRARFQAKLEVLSTIYGGPQPSSALVHPAQIEADFRNFLNQNQYFNTNSILRPDIPGPGNHVAGTGVTYAFRQMPPDPRRPNELQIEVGVGGLTSGTSVAGNNLRRGLGNFNATLQQAADIATNLTLGRKTEQDMFGEELGRFAATLQQQGINGQPVSVGFTGHSFGAVGARAAQSAAVMNGQIVPTNLVNPAPIPAIGSDEVAAWNALGMPNGQVGFTSAFTTPKDPVYMGNNSGIAGLMQHFGANTDLNNVATVYHWPGDPSLSGANQHSYPAQNLTYGFSQLDPSTGQMNGARLLNQMQTIAQELDQRR